MHSDAGTNALLLPSRFTGKERDAETGLDYFGARYYGSNMGRWMSPDWANGADAVPYADFSDPQSLNLYGYVRNNPLSHADVDGHCPDGCVIEFGIAVGAVALYHVTTSYLQSPSGKAAVAGVVNSIKEAPN